MLNFALEKELEGAAWDIWIVTYPNFTEENFISFEDFKNSITKKNNEVFKSDSEIRAEMMKLMEITEKNKERR